jgi:hypothetical protein
MRFTILVLLSTYILSQSENCYSNMISNTRSTYSIGDTLSIEDQNLLFPVCNGSGEYSNGDFFSFSDLNGDLNGGNYKLTIISMNATW